MNYFQEYFKNLDLKNQNIYYKYYHCYRVMDNMELLAKCLNLPYKDIELARCIGLLHDFAKLERNLHPDNFDKSNLDHGFLGAKLIQEKNILSHFNIAQEDYEIVYKAIQNHNQYQIANNLNNKQLMFTKLLRDADKLDILHALSNNKIKPYIIEDNSKISPDIETMLYHNKPIKRNNNHTINDSIVTIFSYAFDINYSVTLKIIHKYQYYEKIYQRLNNQLLFQPYLNYILNYIEKRID